MKIDFVHNMDEDSLIKSQLNIQRTACHSLVAFKVIIIRKWCALKTSTFHVKDQIIIFRACPHVKNFVLIIDFFEALLIHETRYPNDLIKFIHGKFIF